MVDKIETPRDFYSHVVGVDLMEFRNKPDDLRLAYHACVSLLSLRDWIYVNYVNAVWVWNGVTQPPFVYKTDLQSSLEALCDDFRLITDVANASKHLTLDKKRRRTQAEGVANVHVHTTTTYIGGATFGQFMFNVTTFNEPPEIVTEDSVIIDDGGTLYDVMAAVESTSNVWAQLLTENNW